MKREGLVVGKEKGIVRVWTNTHNVTHCRLYIPKYYIKPYYEEHDRRERGSDGYD